MDEYENNVNQGQEQPDAQFDADFNEMMSNFWGDDYNSEGTGGDPEDIAGGDPESTSAEMLEGEIGGAEVQHKMPTIPSQYNLPQQFQPSEMQWQQHLQNVQTKAVDDYIRTQYQGQVNPYTGQPIDSQAAHEQYMYMDARRQLLDALSNNGYDVSVAEKLLDQMVGYHPEVQRAKSDHLNMEQMVQLQQIQQAETFTATSLQNLKRMHPESNINSLSDLYATTEGQQALEFWRKGVPLEMAYSAAFANQITENTIRTAQQKALNQMNSKLHISQPHGEIGKEPIMTTEELANWREFYPNLSNEELTKKWKKTL